MKTKFKISTVLLVPFLCLLIGCGGSNSVETSDESNAGENQTLDSSGEPAGPYVISGAEWESEVLQSDQTVLVDFYADWCGPCRTQAKLLDDFAKTASGLKIVKIDVDQDKDLAIQFKIESIPTLLVFKGGKLVDQHVGIATKEKLASLVE